MVLLSSKSIFCEWRWYSESRFFWHPDNSFWLCISFLKNQELILFCPIVSISSRNWLTVNPNGDMIWNVWTYLEQSLYSSIYIRRHFLHWFWISLFHNNTLQLLFCGCWILKFETQVCKIHQLIQVCKIHKADYHGFQVGSNKNFTGIS